MLYQDEVVGQLNTYCYYRPAQEKKDTHDSVLFLVLFVTGRGSEASSVLY